MNLLSFVAVLGYFLCVVGAGVGLRQAVCCRVFSWFFSVVLVGSLVLHGVLLEQWIQSGAGLNFNLLVAVSFICWLVLLLSLLPFGLQVAGHQLVRLVLFVCCLGSILLVSFVPFEPVWLSVKVPLVVHVVLSLLAYGVLCLAGFQAVLLGFQDRALKTKHFLRLSDFLPAVDWMEVVLVRLLVVGVLFLSLALVSGLLFIEDIFSQHLAHKVFFSVLAWVVFVGLLFGHRRYGWRSQVAARWTVVGLLFLVVGYLGSKFVLEVLVS